MNFRDYEAQTLSVPKGAPMQPVKCRTPNCGCEWFEQVSFSKYGDDLLVAPGQALTDNFHKFTMIRCARCSALQEVPNNLSAWDKKSQDIYVELTTELDKGKPAVEEKK
jgi:hypothetical protein